MNIKLTKTKGQGFPAIWEKLSHSAETGSYILQVAGRHGEERRASYPMLQTIHEGFYILEMEVAAGCTLTSAKIWLIDAIDAGVSEAELELVNSFGEGQWAEPLQKWLEPAAFRAFNKAAERQRGAEAHRKAESEVRAASTQAKKDGLGARLEALNKRIITLGLADEDYFQLGNIFFRHSYSNNWGWVKQYYTEENVAECEEWAEKLAIANAASAQAKKNGLGERLNALNKVMHESGITEEILAPTPWDKENFFHLGETRFHYDYHPERNGFSGGEYYTEENVAWWENHVAERLAKK